ncbi:uncharacterized protein LOC5501003 isoform X2 [Nematostella vectensis]|uniref:uncharacterized protein LOC5501003 isoform X2 n=1 Tax=Nematostella vectensis TaxID=45351 RepID=UPI00139058AB|nr:uncharacterized protein LOC5501003 isoform X2 [Nematostella vectensis]
MEVNVSPDELSTLRTKQPPSQTTDKPVLRSQESLHVPGHLLVPPATLVAHPFPQSLHPSEEQGERTVKQTLALTAPKLTTAWGFDQSVDSHEEGIGDGRKRRLSLASLRGEQKSYVVAAIPVLPMNIAICCCVANVLAPGVGTVLSGFFAFCLSGDDSFIDRATILCINCFVGLAQLMTVVFLMIGWIWSIAWGCTFVGLSAKYGKKRTSPTTMVDESTIS